LEGKEKRRGDGESLDLDGDERVETPRRPSKKRVKCKLNQRFYERERKKLGDLGTGGGLDEKS